MNTTGLSKIGMSQTPDISEITGNIQSDKNYRYIEQHWTFKIYVVQSPVRSKCTV